MMKAKSTMPARMNVSAHSPPQKNLLNLFMKRGFIIEDKLIYQRHTAIFNLIVLIKCVQQSNGEFLTNLKVNKPLTDSSWDHIRPLT